MMLHRKYLLVFFVAVALGKNSNAQDKGNSKTVFHSINTIGLLHGKDGYAEQLQSINGLQLKSWFAGLGIGLDEYRFRTIPLFIDIRKEFGKTAHKWFAYADVGYSFYWQKDTDVKTFPKDSKVQNGFCAETGIGYSIKLNQKLWLLFSGGYSYKTMKEEGRNVYFNPADPPITGGMWIDYAPAYGDITSEQYHLSRLVLKVGLSF
jgi:hypothetical protein